MVQGLALRQTSTYGLKNFKTKKKQKTKADIHMHRCFHIWHGSNKGRSAMFHVRFNANLRFKKSPCEVACYSDYCFQHPRFVLTLTALTNISTTLVKKKKVTHEETVVKAEEKRHFECSNFGQSTEFNASTHSDSFVLPSKRRGVLDTPMNPTNA